jgi:Calcineurin-like phosphoesterase superfamily domain
MRALPRSLVHGPVALAHASAEGPWRAPGAEASDAELERTYGPLGQPVAVYGHIHRSFVRSVAGMIVANTGSVGLSYDGDRRAAYLLVDESKPIIRRVEYDVENELKALSACELPHSEWIAKMLETAKSQMP